MQRHLLTHLSAASRACFRCDYEGCKAKFKWAQTLRQHKQMIHLKDIPFKCSLCPKGFTAEAQLRFHIKYVHQQNRTILCNVGECKKMFANIPRLNRHKEQVHKIKVK